MIYSCATQNYNSLDAKRELRNKNLEGAPQPHSVFWPRGGRPGSIVFIFIFPYSFLSMYYTLVYVLQYYAIYTGFVVPLTNLIYIAFESVSLVLSYNTFCFIGYAVIEFFFLLLYCYITLLTTLYTLFYILFRCYNKMIQFWIYDSKLNFPTENYSMYMIYVYIYIFKITILFKIKYNKSILWSLFFKKLQTLKL